MTINLNKKKYENFVKESKISNGQFTTTDTSSGFLIVLLDGKPNVTLFGEELRQMECSKSRYFTFETDENVFEVNGKVLNGTQTWVQKNDILAEAFIEKEGKTVKINMATNGYVCVNKTLVYFKDIKLTAPISIKNKNNIKYLKSALIQSVILNGQEIMLELKDNDKHVIPDNLELTENMYTKNSDGTFSDVIFQNLILNDIKVEIGKEYYDVTKNFRCTSNGTVLRSDESSTTKIDISVTRYDKQTVNVKTTVHYVSQEELDVSKVSIFVTHEKINPIVVVANQAVTVDEPVKKVECTLSTGTKVISIITKFVKPYKLINGGIMRYEASDATTKSITTSGHYILNGVVHEAKSEITLKENEQSLMLYSEETSTWTTYDLRQESKFNKVMKINVYSRLGQSFDLSTIGWYDKKDEFDYFINGKAYESNKYYLNTGKQRTTESETIIEEIKLGIIRKSDKMSFELFITFVLEESPKITYTLQGDEIFGEESMFARTSFANFPAFFDPCVDYGQFVIYQNKEDYENIIYAHGNAVSFDSKLFNTYPFVKFSSKTTATIETCEKTLKIKTAALSEEFKIKLTGPDQYAKLNHCSDVKCANFVLTIPETTSTCFFKANDNIYLIRSAKTKTMSSTDMGSFLSRKKSMTIEDRKGSFFGKLMNVFGINDDEKSTTTPSFDDSMTAKISAKVEKPSAEHETAALVQWEPEKKTSPVVQLVETAPIVQTVSVSRSVSDVQPAPIKKLTEPVKKAILSKETTVSLDSTVIQGEEKKTAPKEVKKEFKEIVDRVDTNLTTNVYEAGLLKHKAVIVQQKKEIEENEVSSKKSVSTHNTLIQTKKPEVEKTVIFSTAAVSEKSQRVILPEMNHAPVTSAPIEKAINFNISINIQRSAPTVIRPRILDKKFTYYSF